MDFDDHDEHEEEIGDVPVGGSSYDQTTPLGNSSRMGAKMGGGGETGAATGMMRKGVGGTGGGGSRYRECLKNHAVSIGGHAVDGCGEFMAAGAEGTFDALKCAACNCHRNFHRKEVEGGVGGGLGLMGIGEGGGGGGFHHQFSSPYYRTPPAGYLHHHHVAAHHRAPPPLALPSTSGGGGSRDDQDNMSDPMVSGGMGSGGMCGGGGGGSSSGPSKKRFRTKFTQEQKGKMLELAERLGWRMQKHDEAVVQQFCAETGVQRHVLKVWMHNNKHTLGKSSSTTPPRSTTQPISSQQVRDIEMGDRIPGA